MEGGGGGHHANEGVPAGSKLQTGKRNNVACTCMYTITQMHVLSRWHECVCVRACVCVCVCVCARTVLKGGGGTFVTPTEKNAHGDALCFMVMGPSLLQKLAVGGSWWLAVGGWWRLVVGGWRRLVVGSWWGLGVGGCWRLAAVGGRRLAVGSPWGLSLRAVLGKKNFGFLRTALVCVRVRARARARVCKCLMGEYHIKEGCVRVSVCAQFSAERIESARVCVPVELRRLHIP